MHPNRVAAAKRRPFSVAIALISLLGLGAASLLGCAGRLSGVVDFDEDLDFDTVKKFAFYEDAFPLERKQSETRQMTRAAIEQNLRDRGYGFSRAGEADVIIVYHVGNRAKMHFGGMMDSSERTASLSIDFQNPVTRRSVWYGTVEQTWTDKKDVGDRIDRAVATLLDEFPPEGRGETRVRE